MQESRYASHDLLSIVIPAPPFRLPVDLPCNLQETRRTQDSDIAGADYCRSAEGAGGVPT